jgi:hypothetical protein
LRFPLGQIEQFVLRILSFRGNRSHWIFGMNSAPGNQSAKLVYNTILLTRIVVRQILLERLKKSRFRLSCDSNPSRAREEIALLMLRSASAA